MKNIGYTIVGTETHRGKIDVNGHDNIHWECISRIFLDSGNKLERDPSCVHPKIVNLSSLELSNEEIKLLWN